MQRSSILDFIDSSVMNNALININNLITYIQYRNTSIINTSVVIRLSTVKIHYPEIYFLVDKATSCFIIVQIINLEQIKWV